MGKIVCVEMDLYALFKRMNIKDDVYGGINL